MRKLGRLADGIIGRLVSGGKAKAQLTYWEYKCVGNTRYRRYCIVNDGPTDHCLAWEIYGTCKPIP